MKTPDTPPVYKLLGLKKEEYQDNIAFAKEGRHPHYWYREFPAIGRSVCCSRDSKGDMNYSISNAEGKILYYVSAEKLRETIHTLERYEQFVSNAQEELTTIESDFQSAEKDIADVKKKL